VTQAPAIRQVLDESSAWALIRALAKRASSGQPVRRARGLSFDGRGALRDVAPDVGLVSVDPATDPVYRTIAHVTASVEQMLDLYLPLCVGEDSAKLAFGHVGQSLDAQIATASGASRYVTGPENIRHMHRLRALSDAVVVGADTVDRDDPQLTTRLVPGDNPTRVVIDPALRLVPERRLFQDDAAPTLVICARGQAGKARRVGRAEVVEVKAERRMLPPAAILEALAERGLGRIFVEGGGITVSRFLEAGTLARLHVTICPIFIGRGRPGISLPSIDDLGDALRPRARRFDFGDDVLFDLKLDG
jgi:diaminohydroxyphosphoribosylaminopyrimidine deaminase / 5-amino-6-(5-phosphoribosylamino)uracil reductase